MVSSSKSSQRATGGRLRAVAFFGVSLMAATSACAVVLGMFLTYESDLEQAAYEEPTVQVVVARHPLVQGRTITAADLTMKELPLRAVSDHALRMPEQIVGRVPAEAIERDEPVREERLASPDAGRGLNAIIPKGMRALSVDISDGSAVSGFLEPGNYVDVLVTLDPASSRDATETVTLLQAVTVLAVDTRLGGPRTGTAEGRPSVTVAVSPEQAERLTHAVAEGEVTLTLRNDIDVTHVETHGTFTGELLGGDDDEQRITVQEWRERTTTSRDGTLLIIHGSDVQRQR